MKEYKSAYELLTDCPKELAELETIGKESDIINDIIAKEGWALEEASEKTGLDIGLLESIQEGKVSDYCLFRGTTYINKGE